MTDEAGQNNTDTGAEGQADTGSDTGNTLLTGAADNADTGGDQGNEGQADASSGSDGSDNGGDDNGSDAGGDSSSGDDTGEGADQLPESYNFDMGEGIEFDATLGESLGEVFKDAGITQGQMDKINAGLSEWQGRMATEAQSAQEAADAEAQSQVDGWAKETKAKYGDKFKEEVGLSIKGMEHIGGDADGIQGIRDVLDQTGLGNHPSIVAAFSFIGRMISEDQPGHGGRGFNEQSLEERMYPNEAKG